jgi:hypothetical protein
MTYRSVLSKTTPLMLSITIMISGCSHRLEIKNLSLYRPTSINPLTKPIAIGIATSEEDICLKKLVRGVGTELQKYSRQVFLPYNRANGQAVDVIAEIRVTPTYKGSGWNFLINWPGFLIFTPAWHGYDYKVDYKVDIALYDTAKNQKFDEFSLPIKLDVRHAAMGRTWTEVSWFEVSAIALIGGMVFTGYDPHVTPLVAEESSSILGEYIGQEIVSRINATKKFTQLFLLEPTERLAMK